MIEATVDFTDAEVDEMDRDGVLAGLESARAELERLNGTAFLGKALEQGVQTAIVGRPNVGKSSLLNALLMRERAIVSEIAGTTRDTVEESMEIGGIPIRLVDTAGMRSGGGRVEQLGVERSVKVMEQADLVLAVFDGSRPWSASDQRLARRLIPGRSIIVGSKGDLAPDMTLSSLLERVARTTKCENWRGCLVSATRGDGLDELRELITRGIGGEAGIHLEEPVLATERQRELVERSVAGTDSAIGAVVRQADEELVCEDIRLAIEALGQITGEDLTVDLLDEIFSRFCIGK
jgi:tRNA modification GTPase